MVQEWDRVHHAPAAVIDVGAGVGAFTTAAAATWPDAAIWAIDINPVTLGLLAARVAREFAIKTSDDPSPGVRVVRDDFTLWMSSIWPKLRGPRLILGNPPYTRLQLLPESERERLNAAGGGLCGRRASLSTLIAAQSLLSLGPRDGLSLLLPAQWLEAEYAAELRAKLWSLNDRKVTMRLFEDGLFDDATVDAVALTVGPEQQEPQSIEFSISTRPTAPAVSITDRRGNPPPEFRSGFARRTKYAVAAGVELRELLDVRRGTATGANRYFALTADVAAQHGLPTDATIPLIRRVLGVPDEATTRWLRSVPPEDKHVLFHVDNAKAIQSEAVTAYVKSGVDQQINERYLCRVRRTWFDLRSETLIPDLIIGQSTRHAFRLVTNTAGVTILNNLYGMTWRPGVDDDTRGRLVAWLRSDNGQDALRSASRVHGSKLLKIEPGALKQLQVPRGLLSG